MELIGKLLVAHPLYPEGSMKKSVMLMINQGSVLGNIGICINKPFVGVDFNVVMLNAGLNGDFDELLYKGGDNNENRVYVVHSLDWSSPSTVHLNDQIGVSTDLSILAALSQGQGPEYFRACAGYHRWDKNQLEGELSGKDPWSSVHMWSQVPSSIELVFDLDWENQWKNLIACSANLVVNSWF